MKQPHDIVERLARGEVTSVDAVGTNHAKAWKQASDIVNNTTMTTHGVLVALITRMQEQDKSIEMFEYTQKWRKRRP